ncbi:MAG: HEPN domain-containing protein [Sedimentisphaerales bacterium]
MTKEEKALIAYRIERAHEAIEEAEMLFNAGHINLYVNRLYYACFYAVSALLLTKDLSTSKHGYLRSLMHRELVKTGLIPKELGRHFDMLFDSRLEGDYADFTSFKADEVVGWLEQTQAFIKHIEGLISKLV